MTHLNEIISDIGRCVITNPLPTVPTYRSKLRWHEIAPSDFGPTWDFETEKYRIGDSTCLKSIVIFEPVSVAALAWCYAHLPEDCPRYGKRGFLIEAVHIKGVIGGARRDKLMSHNDYFEALEESHQQMLQGEY